MSVCAVVRIEDNKVENIIVAEPTYLPPNNTYLVICDDNLCDIGWIWNGIEFINPNLNVEETNGN